MNFLLLLIVLSYTNYYYFVVIFSYLLGSFPLSLVFCSLILVGESVDLLFHFPWFFKILLDHRYLISFIISINLLALGFFWKFASFPLSLLFIIYTFILCLLESLISYYKTFLYLFLLFPIISLVLTSISVIISWAMSGLMFDWAIEVYFYFSDYVSNFVSSLDSLPYLPGFVFYGFLSHIFNFICIIILVV